MQAELGVLPKERGHPRDGEVRGAPSPQSLHRCLHPVWLQDENPLLAYPCLSQQRNETMPQDGLLEGQSEGREPARPWD